MTRSIRTEIVGACVCALVGLAAERSGAQGQRAREYDYRIAYATYVGGSEGEQLREVIPRPDGSVLVGGQTNSPDLPVTPGAAQGRYGGEPAGTGHGGIYGGDCFLLRLSADGAKVLACTYFGGSKQERNTYGMSLDSQGNVIIATGCRSRDLPTTEGAYQRKYGGGMSDVMLVKLAGDLTKTIWCTYVGGRGEDWPRGGIAVDKDDNVVVVGRSTSPDFPGTEGVLRRQVGGANGDAMIVKVKADGTGLVWATLLGGSDWDGLMGARLDAAGNVYLAGHTRSSDFPVTAGAPQAKLGGSSDCFLAKLSADAGKVLYATYLGGRENEFAEHRLRLCADGAVLLTGVTSSPDFPTTPGAVQRSLGGKTDGFLTKLSADGRRLVFSTLLGGSDGEFYLMPTPDAKGNIFVVGTTRSRDFPVTGGALQTKFAGATGQWDGDGALAVLSADGSKLLYATYLGGSGADLIRSIALGPKGEVYLVGSTSSKDFPVTPGAAGGKLNGKGDAFVVKLVPK